MAADLYHLLSVDTKKHKYEKTVKDKGCMSENEMFLQWGELCKGERSYRADVTCLHQVAFQVAWSDFLKIILRLNAPSLLL